MTPPRPKSEAAAKGDWHSQPAEQVLAQLGTALTGLSTDEVGKRQKEFGPNRGTARLGTPAWLKFLQQFNQPLVYILLLAVGVTAFLGEWVDSSVIFGVVIINAIIGFLQEAKAEKTIEALAKMVATEATVRHYGRRLRVHSEQLVPGDVVLLQSGDRVPVGAITPCGQCRACFSGLHSQCDHGFGCGAMGGWRFGNAINGAQAEYLLVPYAQANLAKIPDEVTDEQVVLLADIATTCFGGAESGGIKIGDTVVVFAQGPTGLCATVGATVMGAPLTIGVDGDEHRLKMARTMGADVTLNYRECNVVEEVLKRTRGGADVVIEALGTQETFESCLRCLRPDGTLSGLGVYSGKLQISCEAYAAGLGDPRIVTTLCADGKERMRCLINVAQSGRFDPTMLVTHLFSLADIQQGYEVFGKRSEGVLKVLITP